MKDVGIVTESESFFLRALGALTKMGFSVSLSNVNDDDDEDSDG
jgi:hypothetical protein